MFETQRGTEILELSYVTRPSTRITKYSVSAALDWPVSDRHIIRLCGVKPGNAALTSRRPVTGVSTDATDAGWTDAASSTSKFAAGENLPKITRILGRRPDADAQTRFVKRRTHRPCAVTGKSVGHGLVL